METANLVPRPHSIIPRWLGALGTGLVPQRQQWIEELEQQRRNDEDTSTLMVSNGVRVHILQARVAHQRLQFYRECRPIE